MTQLLKINNESIQKAATAILAGRLVVYPTDTVYGLGCDPLNDRAVAELLIAKNRVKSSLPILVSTLEKANELGMMNMEVEPLARRFWPGPLTIVVPSRVTLPLAVTGPERTIGLRIPGRADTRDLISKSGGSIIGTSANISERPSIRTASAALNTFDGKVEIVLDGGDLGTGQESTVVRVTDHGVQVLREAAVSRAAIKSALGPSVQLLG